MKRKTPTNKDRDQVIVQLIDKVFQLEVILSLTLEHDKKLDKFVKDRIAASSVEIAKNRSKDKEGT